MMPLFQSSTSPSTVAVIIAVCVAPLTWSNNVAWLGPAPATCIVVPTAVSPKPMASRTTTVKVSLFASRNHHDIEKNNQYGRHSDGIFHTRESKHGWVTFTRKRLYSRGEIIMRMSLSREDENEKDISEGEKEIKSQETNETSKHHNLNQTTKYDESKAREQTRKRPRYSLGLGKNRPLSSATADIDKDSNGISAPSQEQFSAALNWNAPEPVSKPDLPNSQRKRSRYNLGVGKNAPVGGSSYQSKGSLRNLASSVGKAANVAANEDSKYDPNGDGSNVLRGANRTRTRHLLTLGDEESAILTKAVWDKGHFNKDDKRMAGTAKKKISSAIEASEISNAGEADGIEVENQIVSTGKKKTAALDKRSIIGITNYEQIDLSVPQSVYCLGSYTSNNTNAGTEFSEPIDLVWDLMRYEARIEAEREPLLVSFLYSTILNHPTLESALSFHLANRLSSPAMLSTQIMSLIREALDADPEFRRNLRADILAVRDRDPACTCLPDVFLYFKGFHALQTYRVAHYLWKSGRRILAHYLQSQVSQNFQIDIHPNATLGSGIMLDHGTGIVIGETAHLGHNCSVLHHVTLGGSGKKGVDRHPKVGNGVLLGAGASVLGNIKIGDGCQVGAGTLVIEDLPPGVVAVGVPAKIIGKFVDITAQPSIGMNQLGSKEADENIIMYGMDGI